MKKLRSMNSAKGLSMLNSSKLIFLFTISFLSAQQNNSYFFIPDGNNGDYVECTIDQSSGASQNLEPTAGMTLEFWVQHSFVDAPDNYVGIVNYMTLAGTEPDDEAGFAFIYFNGLWRFIVCVSNESDIFGAGLQNWPGVELEFDQWVHIAATYDGEDVKIYKNGELSQTHSTDGGAIKWTAINKKLDIAKGIEYGGAPNDKYFEGAIDEVRVWSIAQTQVEIQTNMSQVIGAEIGLEAYWNFNDNQSTNVQDQTGNGYPGTLYQNGTGFWFDDIFAGGDPTGACCDDVSGDCEENTEGDCNANGGTWQGDGTTCNPNPCDSSTCFDQEITEANFPFNFLSDLSTENNDWDMNTFPFPGGGEHNNGADGNDYAYKITLSEPAKIYVTTCDPETDVDVQIAIYTIDCDNSSWIMFQDDSNLPIFYPDQTSEQYDFACASGYSNPEYSNMLPGLQMDAGTYYIVVDDRSTGPGAVHTWIGYSLELDSSNFAEDNSSLELYFNDNIYGGEYPGGFALETDDFKDTLTVQDNATGSVINSVTDLAGGQLSGGETNFKLNLGFDDDPSGGEIMQIGPKDEKSIFNNIGVPLIDTDAMLFSLNDMLNPFIESTNPSNNDTDVEDDVVIEIHFNEPLRQDDGTSLNNSNVDDHITLTDITDNQLLSFSASVTNAKDITLTPENDFIGFHEIDVSIAGPLQDSVSHPFSNTSFSFIIKDNVPPMLENAIVNDENSIVLIAFNESVYTNDDGTNGLENIDFSISFYQNNGTASNVQISSLTDVNGNQLMGGEDTVLIHLNSDGSASGVETIEIIPASNNAIFDLAGNALSATQTTGILVLNDQLIPTIDAMTIDDGSLFDLSENTSLTFTFSENVDSVHYVVSAQQYSNLNYSADLTDNTLTIDFIPPLMALDTINIEILEIIDSAGNSTVDLFYEFYTPALGDYDMNDTIDVLDLTDFIKGWKAKNYAFELGPNLGKIPHFLPTFDSEFGLEDGMVFIQMWGWAQENFGFNGINKPTIGIQPHWLEKSVTIPAGTMSGQVYIQYDPSVGRMEVTPPAYGANGISLKHHEPETGRMIIEFGNFADELVEYTFTIIPYMDQPAYFTVTHVFYHENGRIISSGTQNLKVIIPNEFTLYPNFPNPFNPITTINYAISEQGKVTMDIYDINGRWVSNLIQAKMDAGFYDIKWDAGNYASGIYFCRLTTEKDILTSKLLLVK